MIEDLKIPVKPDAEERRQIRGLYDRSGITLLAFLAFFYFFGSFITLAIINRFFTPGTEGYTNAGNIISILITILLEVGVIFLGSRLTGINLRSLFSVKGFTAKTVVKTYVTAQGLGYIGSFIVVFIISIVTLIAGKNIDGLSAPIVEAMAQSDFSMVLIIIYSVVFAPILEELIFRGIILNSLSKYDRTFAIIVSSIMFGVTHGNFQQAFYATIMGIVLAAVDLRYNSIVPSVIVHTCANAFSAIAAITVSSSGYLETAAKAIDNPNPFEIVQGITPAMIISIMVVYTFVIAFIITAIVIVIRNRRRFREFFNKTTALGKARSLPIFFTSIPWDINIAAAIFVIFIKPFAGII
jgi:membrane protease YdiL (CAAX protease family)